MTILGRLLVVDDEAVIATQLKKYLQSRHYHVSLAESGEQALKILLRESFDILLTDLMMPGMNGLELIGHAKGLQPDIQCLLISGQGDMDSAIKAIQHGVINYLSKPLSLDELDVAIEYGMERIWLRQEAQDKQRELEWRNVRLHQELLERKRQAENERQLDAKILKEQKLASLGVMAGGIAHEFNNLLTCIIGFSELASLKLPPDTTCQEHLRQVLRAGRRAAKLTKQMLDYTGKGKMLTTSVNLSQFLGGMANLIESTLPRGIKVELRLSDNLPTIEADINQLHQLIINLLTNASESVTGPEGTITVETGFTNDSTKSPFPGSGGKIAPEHFIYLKISDTGGGMSEEIKAKIFDPFFSTKFQGRGLGMAAALGIVRGHEGEIVIDSSPGKGTVVTVIFPSQHKIPSLARAISPPVKAKGLKLGSKSLLGKSGPSKPLAPIIQGNAANDRLNREITHRQQPV